LRSQASDFSEIAFYYRDSGFSQVTLAASDGPEYAQGAFVTANLFSLMGVAPEVGRVFTPEEVQHEERVVVLSHRLWLDRFGGSPDALGKSLQIDGVSYLVVGVMPAVFQFPAPDQEFWAPITANRYWGEVLAPNNDPLMPQHNRYFYERWQAIGRLKSSVSLAQAQAQMGVIFGRLRQQDHDANRATSINLVPLRVRLSGQTRLALYVLFVAVCFVLLIACSNVANLVLARGIVREGEMAVRSALGASRGRLFQQLLTESAILALIAGSVAVMLAYAGVRVLVALAPAGIPRIGEAGINPTVLAFAAAVSLATAAIFGVAPSRTISRTAPDAFLKPRGRSAAGSMRGERIREMLVVLELSLTVVLLTGASLLLRSLLAGLSVDAGFQPAHLLTMSISPSATTPQTRNEFHNEVLHQLRALPGVQAVGEVSELFESASMNSQSLRVIEGRAPEPKDEWTPLSWVAIRGDFFQAMRARLLRGRYFNESDGANSPLVAIIDESMARRFWPGENPIGRRFKGFDPRGRNDNWITVVGVVSDMRRSGPEIKPIPHVYEPYAQAIDGDHTADVVVRISNSPALVAPTLRQVVRNVDPGAIASRVTSAEDDLFEQLAPERFNTSLLALFAVVALVLASVGTFGVVHYTVAQRTREIGIRMALGAQPWDVLRGVLGQGARMTLTGIAIGVAASLGLTRLISTMLFGVSTTDPLTFAAVVALLLAVALIACWIPARKAMRVDPMVALRHE
jgi:putative ABC transport system permease protein